MDISTTLFSLRRHRPDPVSTVRFSPYPIQLPGQDKAFASHCSLLVSRGLSTLGSRFPYKFVQ